MTVPKKRCPFSEIIGSDIRRQKEKRSQDMSRVSMIQHINLQISDREHTRDWY